MFGKINFQNDEHALEHKTRFPQQRKVDSFVSFT